MSTLSGHHQREAGSRRDFFTAWHRSAEHGTLLTGRSDGRPCAAQRWLCDTGQLSPGSHVASASAAAAPSDASLISSTEASMPTPVPAGVRLRPERCHRCFHSPDASGEPGTPGRRAAEAPRCLMTKRHENSPVTMLKSH